MMPFVHLHCHSYYSFFNGTASPAELVQRANELNMPALALTDYCNLHGIPEFCRSARQYGIKPILGIESVVAGYGLTLLAMNEEGWRNLIQLSSFAFLNDTSGMPTIDKELLRKHHAGLICLSGFAGGEIGRLLTDDPTSGYENAKTASQWYQDAFGDRYYLELRNHGIKAQETLFEQTVGIGRELGIETVATNDIHYLDQVDWNIHDILLCIKNVKKVSDEDRPKMGSDQHFFRNEAEMFTAFSGQDAAVHRTVEIADRIEPDIFEKFYSKRHHPVFPLPPAKSADELLRELCVAGFEKRYTNSLLANKAKQRLESELAVIQKFGQANYFLIIGDIARFAEEQGIYYTARGSSPGSLVCHVLGISPVCPLEFGLLFERFFDENRMPDIDIDFDHDRRGEIIDYVMEKYGKDNIVPLGTIGTFGLKMAIKDIGRAFDKPIPFIDDVVELIPCVLKPTLGRALEESAELNHRYKNEPQVKELLNFANELLLSPRSTGVHPCGFVIADVPLVDYVPLRKDHHDTVATQ